MASNHRYKKKEVENVSKRSLNDGTGRSTQVAVGEEKKEEKKMGPGGMTGATELDARTEVNRAGVS